MAALPPLVLDRMPSPLGPLLLVCDDVALHALDFHDHEARMRRLLGRRHGADRRTPVAGRAPGGVTHALEAYFAGEPGALDAVVVRPGGTEFQRRVWAALREIPSGTTTTYGRLAAAIGRPGAARAVGLANGSNPIGIVVPCHRVVGADGTLTGYAGGVERKRWLLDHERRWAPTAAAGRTP